MKLEKIRKLYAPKIDPSTCKNDRLYKVTVYDYETIGWRGSKDSRQWCVRNPDETRYWVDDSKVTVLGEYHPKDEHVGRVYERIEDAVADGMGRYTVLEDSNGSRWLFDNGIGISNSFAPFTVLHWAPKEVGE